MRAVKPSKWDNIKLHIAAAIGTAFIFYLKDCNDKKTLESSLYVEPSSYICEDLPPKDKCW